MIRPYKINIFWLSLLILIHIYSTVPCMNSLTLDLTAFSAKPDGNFIELSFQVDLVEEVFNYDGRMVAYKPYSIIQSDIKIVNKDKLTSLDLLKEVRVNIMHPTSGDKLNSANTLQAASKSFPVEKGIQLFSSSFNLQETNSFEFVLPEVNCKADKNLYNFSVALIQKVQKNYALLIVLEINSKQKTKPLEIKKKIRKYNKKEIKKLATKIDFSQFKSFENKLKSIA